MVKARALEADLYVFDFDGTLVDSNPIKYRAFESCFARPEFAARREEILSYCRGNNHTPRGEKFRHVYERILSLPYTADAEQQLHRRFEQETTQAIIGAPEVQGASGFLESVRRKAHTAVLSSTPHPILREILEARGWLRYFDLKRGAPVVKADWLKGLQGLGYPAGRILFFGDTPEDARAAERAGCPFVTVGKEPLPGSRTAIPDFKGLLS